MQKTIRDGNMKHAYIGCQFTPICSTIQRLQHSIVTINGAEDKYKCNFKHKIDFTPKKCKSCVIPHGNTHNMEE